MTLPAFLFGFLIATIYGAAFHFWLGGGAGRLVYYLILAWVGFWMGHLAGWYWDIGFFNLGALYLGMATLGSAVVLAGGHWIIPSINIPKAE